MKPIIPILAIMLFVMQTGAIQAQEGIHEPGTGINNPEVKEQGSGQGLSTTATATITASQDQIKLQTYIRDQSRQMDQDRLQLDDTQRRIAQDQDRMLLGAATLEEIQTLIPQLKTQLTPITQQLRTATQKTVQAETQLRQRNNLLTFFFGSDKNALAILEQQTSQTQERLRELQQLQQSCPCDEQVKNTVQLQIRSMIEEQNRLQTLITEQKNNFGLLGRFFPI